MFHFADGENLVQYPAIVQNVAKDGTVRLFVIGPKGAYYDEGLKEGTGASQWAWPARESESDSREGKPDRRIDPAFQGEIQSTK